MNEARVYLEGELIGQIKYQNEKIEFTYENSWVNSGYAISHSLPLSGGYSTIVSHQFFSNLLPEGTLRDQICRKLKISADNDWALLLCLGKESAGALTIISEENEKNSAHDYKKISAKDLDHFSQSKNVMPQIISNEATRLSLAGAQGKMAVYFDGKDYFLPINGAPTNRILKFENEEYRQITVNEIFLNMLAAKLGFRTSQCELYIQSKKPIAIFHRYDRKQKKNGIERIHQEDTCQALGRSQKNKYQKEGGPSLKEVLDLISEISHDPLHDRQALIRWQVFNILCGNSDGHGKNLSFLRTREEIRLTPFYDLVCTRVFKTLDRHLAMSVAGSFDPDTLDILRLEQWSQEIGVTKKFLLGEVGTMAELVSEYFPAVEKEFVSRYGEFGLLEQIRLFISKQIRRQQNRLRG